MWTSKKDKVWFKPLTVARLFSECGKGDVTMGLVISAGRTSSGLRHDCWVIWRSQEKWGVLPQWMVYFMENHTKLDKGYSPILGNLHLWYLQFRFLKRKKSSGNTHHPE